MTTQTTQPTTDQITVRVTLDGYDFARPSEKQTQVYVQIPEVARVSYLLPAARFHGLKDRAWPEVLDVAQEHYAQGWVIDPSSAVARQAVMEWLRDATHRDEMQVAYEEDQARQNPVLRNLRARITELETDREANDREYEQATARVAELESERHTTNESLSDAAEQLRRDRDRIAELEVELYTAQAHGRTYLEQRNAHAKELLELRRMAGTAETAGLELPESALKHVQAILLSHFAETPRPDMAVGLLLTNLRTEWEAEGRARIADLEAAREQLVRWHGEDSKTITTLVARVDRYRAELTALRNDALSMRGSLSPNGGDRKVPFELGQTLAPAVDWLIARVAELETAQGTVYRASHDSIVMGLYRTATEARAHCVAEERRTWASSENPVFDWIEDEEDGVAELTTVTEDGETESVTGYVVDALEVAAKYDEEADE